MSRPDPAAPSGPAPENAESAFEGSEQQELVDTDAPVLATFSGAGLIAEPRLSAPVLVSDRIPVRQRRVEDAVEAAAAFGGMVLVLLIGVYAQSTTQGVADDFRAAFGNVIREILFLPFSVLEGLFVIAAPVALVISLLRRAEYPSIIHTVLTGASSALVCWGLLLSVPYLPSFLKDSLVISTPTGELSTVNLVFVVLAAMCTVAGTSGSNAVIRYSWWGLWILLFFSLIRGAATVPGMLLTVLLGRFLGSLARLIAGFNDGRAGPTDLVEACLEIGLQPVRIIRVDLDTTTEPLETWRVVEGSGAPDSRQGQIHPPLTVHSADSSESEFQVTPQFNAGRGRLYQAWLEDGRVLDMHVSDPDVGFAAMADDVWQNIRLKGASRWVSPAIKPAAERIMLTAAAASRTGVRTSRPAGLAEAGTSIVVFWEVLPPVISLYQAHESGIDISDAIIDQLWEQLHSAHTAGICHRNIDIESLRVDELMNPWILDWNHGDLGQSGLTRLIDCAQMLVHLSLVVGPERAMASAQKQLGRAELLSTGLVLQSAILPRALRNLARKAKMLERLRDEMSLIAPTAQAPEPLKVERFSPRTVIMTIIAAGALVVLFGSLNFDAVADAVKHSNPWWLVVAFGLGAFTWVTAAIPLVAFSPKKIGLGDTTLAQMAASIVALVAPAGIGPAAVNLRYLNKKKVSTPVAVATVTLVQISQFLTSVTLLLILVVATGTSVQINFPTRALIWIFAAAATVVAAAFSIPKLRRWVVAKVEPAWNQAYPQLLWILGHPRQLAIAFGGNLLMNLSFIGAFGAALAAFGWTLNPVSLAITFLVSTALGSVIPTPGGIGPVEAALTAGLQVAGIPPAIALSAAVSFRLMTFYGRIPFGWLALKRMEKKKLL